MLSKYSRGGVVVAGGVVFVVVLFCFPLGDFYLVGYISLTTKLLESLNLCNHFICSA